MAKSIRRTIIEVAVESTYGVDPGGPYTPILSLEGASITPNSQLIERATYSKSYASQVPVVGAKWFDISIPVEWRGAPNVSTSPEWGYLMRGCQHREITTGEVCNSSGGPSNGPLFQGEMLKDGGQNYGRLGGIYQQANGDHRYFIYDVENPGSATDTVTGELSGASFTIFSAPSTQILGYIPTSEPAETESLTIRFNYEGTQFVSKGVYLSYAFDGTNQQNPTLTFTGQGLYAEPTDQASPTVTYQVPKPLPFFDAHPWIMIDDGSFVDLTKAPIQQITLAQNNEINQREDIAQPAGLIGYVITGRGMTGSINPEMADVADFNPYDAWARSAQNFLGFSLDRLETQGTVLVCSVGNAIWQTINQADRTDIAVNTIPFTAADGGDGDGEVSWWCFS